jgi:polyisoprenoid-binding protein YceI
MAVVSALLTAGAASAEPYAWDIDPNHSQIGFVVRHLAVAKVRGKFHKWDSKIVLDDKDLTLSEIEIEIDVPSIDTGNDRRDNHLKSSDFFLAKKHPKMIFRSKAINKKGKDRFTMVGDLTIRGHTQPITIEWQASDYFKDPGGNEHIAFSGEAEIDRFDFGLAWNKAVEGGGSLVVAREVKLELEIELFRKRAPSGKS